MFPGPSVKKGASGTVESGSLFGGKFVRVRFDCRAAAYTGKGLSPDVIVRPGDVG